MHLHAAVLAAMEQAQDLVEATDSDGSQARSPDRDGLCIPANHHVLAGHESETLVTRARRRKNNTKITQNIYVKYFAEYY